MKEKTETKQSINPLIISIVVVVIVGVAAFWGGMKYQQSKMFTFGNGRYSANGQFGRGNGGMMGNRSFRPVSGQVISLDDKSMTVKMADGSTKIVLLSDGTTYSKSDSGSKADVKTGENVAVFGNENSDGSVTAQNVQLNPQLRMLESPSATSKP